MSLLSWCRFRQASVIIVSVFLLNKDKNVWVFLADFTYFDYIIYIMLSLSWTYKI